MSKEERVGGGEGSRSRWKTGFCDLQLDLGGKLLWLSLQAFTTVQIIHAEHLLQNPLVLLLNLHFSDLSK